MCVCLCGHVHVCVCVCCVCVGMCLCGRVTPPLTKSMVLAVSFDSRLHHVSHQSQSCGRDLMGTAWIILLGKS